VATSPAPTFALEAVFQLGTLIGAAREISVSDYFDRLALDRAIDSIAYAHRNLTAEAARVRASGSMPCGLEREARGRRQPHPRRGRQHRGVGPDALEGHGGGEPPRRSGADELIPPPHWHDPPG
jgi:hypothetical protein